ncbi:hypothetical protein, partial [Paracidovorax cattleyae]|uniref:hypothetical protein n=1 Tax=Paracidovorax cattleyae TaxID=80868 RepID=UPI001E311B2A
MGDGALAHLALVEAPAHDHALHALPGPVLQEAQHHVRELLRIVLRSGLDGPRRHAVLGEHLVEALLADLARGLVAQRVLAGHFRIHHAPGVQHVPERRAAGVVACEAVAVA